nr:hypothetical protein GTC16762_12520 [Pigmentibacter ruber]
MFQNILEILTAEEYLRGYKYRVLFFPFSFFSIINYIFIYYKNLLEKSNILSSIENLIDGGIKIKELRFTKYLNTKYDYKKIKYILMKKSEKTERKFIENQLKYEK